MSVSESDHVLLPVGTPIERTEDVVMEVENFIKEHMAISVERETGITNWASFIGQGAPRFILPYGPEMASPEYAFILMNKTGSDIIDELISPLEGFCNDQFPDLKPTVRPLDLGPPAWPPVEVRISGRDPNILFDIVDLVKAKLRTIAGTKLIDDDWGARTKKIVVQVNQPRARRAGITSQDVAISLQTYFSGFETTEYREQDKLIPITLRSVRLNARTLTRSKRSMSMPSRRGSLCR